MMGAVPALELRGVTRNVGGLRLLDGVSLSIPTGQCWALIGPNGAGKTSLFHVISGLTAPCAGQVVLHGRDVTGWAAHRLRQRGLARSFQINQLFGGLSVLDHLCCAALSGDRMGYAFWRPLSSARDVMRDACALAEALGLEHHLHSTARELTYAQQRHLELGLALAGSSTVLLLDEPTSGMSRQEAGDWAKRLRQLARGRTVLLVEHDLSVAFAVADRVAVLHQGRLITDAPASEITRDPRVQAAYGADSMSRGSDMPWEPGRG